MKRTTELILDDSGKLSLSRVLMIMIILVYLICMICSVIVKGIMLDIPINLAGLVAILYGANKFSPKATAAANTTYVPGGGR